MQRTSVTAKKILNSGLMILKKNGKVSILPKAFFQINPFHTRRFMATGRAAKPGTTLRKNKKNAQSEALFSTKTKEITPWGVTEVVSKQIGISEVFERITYEGKLIPKRERLDNLQKCVDSLNNKFNEIFGLTPAGLMRRLGFSIVIKDPSKLGELIFNIISIKNSFSGHYNLMNGVLRKKSKGIKTGEDEQSDHGIAVSDVGLKLIIQTLRYNMPTLEEFEEIYEALNDKSNRRAVPNDVHDIITGLEAHKLNTEGKRMLSIEEKLETLSSTDRKTLNKYLKKGNKNFGTVQEEYCTNFVSKLSSSQSEFVRNFSDNFNDFYINHVLYKVQRGGGFDSEEQNLLVLLLYLLKDHEPNTNNTTSESNSNEDDHVDISNAYNELLYIKNLMTGFFKTAKDIYHSASKDTDEEILDRYDKYLEYKYKTNKPARVSFSKLLKNVYDMDSEKDLIEMKGGRTRKQNRRR